jgi:acetyl esterase/lipase
VFRGHHPLTVGARAALVVSAVTIVALTAACSTEAPDAPFSIGTVHRDLTYCNGETLDLYIPREALRPLPIALYVHGGGMTAGDKSDINPVFLNALATDRYAVASLNYRLAPQFHFPAQIEDVKCAIRYLRDRAPAYGPNAHEVFAFGTSVGGELVAIAALTGSRSAFDVGPYAAEPSGLSAAVDMFGPADLTQAASGFTSADIEQVFGDNRREVLLASPTHYVRPGAPPMLLVQGVDDTKVLTSQSMQLSRDLAAAGDRTQLILVQHMGHMFMQVGAKPLLPSERQIAADMDRFFDAVRGG